jgi:plasmid stabilization system protein ParE
MSSCVELTNDGWLDFSLEGHLDRTDARASRLIEIQDFIARADPDAAERLPHRIIERGDGLSRFPEMGRTVPELPGTGIREIIEGRYRIVHRIQGRVIQILAVFEGHRQFPLEDVVE